MRFELKIEHQASIDQNKIESRKFYHFIKRFLDILLSTLGLLGLSPVMGVIAYKIKKEDGGPIFYNPKCQFKLEKG